MKKLFLGIVTLAMFFVSGSCRKALNNVNDYFPKIKTVSAVIQTDGSVKIIGDVQSIGMAKNSVMDQVGFCVSTSAEPKMLDNQLIATLDGSTFTKNYPVTMFSVDSVYYFRSWATNNYGYVYGDIIRVDSIIATPVIAPCTLASNSVNIGGGNPTYYYSTVGAPDTYYYFSASTGSGPSVNFQFGSPLTTGVFHTTTNTSPSFGEVFVSFYSGFISGALADGSNVYVNMISASTYEITICSAPWTYSSSTFYFNTHFVTPY
jgi:hypothetical protein